jgi:hypothetical protein
MTAPSRDAAPEAPPLLEARDIWKAFPGVQALAAAGHLQQLPDPPHVHRVLPVRGAGCRSLRRREFGERHGAGGAVNAAAAAVGFAAAVE